MSLPEALLAAVEDEESLARFIVHKSDVRANLTLRPDPFIPHPYPDLSVTRHTGLNDPEIWSIGEAIVAVDQQNTLYGRGDLSAAFYRSKKLIVLPKPTHENRSHAQIEGWAPDKPSQKIVALELSREARYTARPQPTTAPNG